MMIRLDEEEERGSGDSGGGCEAEAEGPRRVDQAGRSDAKAG